MQLDDCILWSEILVTGRSGAERLIAASKRPRWVGFYSAQLGGRLKRCKFHHRLLCHLLKATHNPFPRVDANIEGPSRECLALVVARDQPV